MVVLITSLLIAAGPEVMAYETGSLQYVYLQPEEPIYKVLHEPYSDTGCFCGMCLGNGSSGYRQKRVVVNTPSPMKQAERALRAVGVTSKDVVFDLGCGDGRVCLLAAREFGARSVGLDIREEAVKLSQANARRSGVDHLCAFYELDALRTDLKHATVVYCYLSQDAMTPMARKLGSGRYRNIRVAISHHHPWPGRGLDKVGNCYVWWMRPKVGQVGEKPIILRVWYANWCDVCSSDEWMETLRKADEVPNVTIQKVDRDKYASWCNENGIGSLPCVQVFHGEGDEAEEVNRITGAVSFQKLLTYLPTPSTGLALAD